MLRAVLFSLLLALSSSAPAKQARTKLSPADEFLLACARGEPACADEWSALAPPTFSVLFTTAAGGRCVVHAVSEWSPPHAQRFYTLSRLRYFEGAPFYRVLRGAAADHVDDFVAQFGYRGVPEVDAEWLKLRMSTETAPVLATGGNRRGSVAFGTGSIKRNASVPFCTADDCSYGFSVELFVNTGTENAGKLDAADFSPFGYIIDCSELGVVDSVYAGYGEMTDICAPEGGQSSVGAYPRSLCRHPLTPLPQPARATACRWTWGGLQA